MFLSCIEPSDKDDHDQRTFECLTCAYAETVTVKFRKLSISGSGGSMAIYKSIANGSFGPDEINVMKAAYEAALVDVGVSDRDDPITELIAKSIVNVTATGERDPKAVMQRALNALGVRRAVA
jgi:hypothetical protein